MKKKEKLGKLKKKVILKKKLKKKKSGEESLWITCNPQWNMCGGTIKKNQKYIILKNKEIK